MKGHRQKVVAAQLAGGAAFGTLLGLAFVTWISPKHHNFGGITCSEVANHADDYIAGRLDPELTRQIDRHLAECPLCGPQFRQIMEDRKAQQADRKVTKVDDGPVPDFATFDAAIQPVLVSTRQL